MPAGESTPTVEVVYALPDRQRIVSMPLPAAGLTAREAVERSGLLDEFPELRGIKLPLGIYGEPCADDRPLRHRDRVEIYRALRIDPRLQRRERVAATPRKGWNKR